MHGVAAATPYRARRRLYLFFTFSLPKFGFAPVKESKLVAKHTFQRGWRFLRRVLGGNPSNCQRSGGVPRLKPRTVSDAQFTVILIHSGRNRQTSSDGVRTNCDGVNPGAEIISKMAGAGGRGEKLKFRKLKVEIQKLTRSPASCRGPMRLRRGGQDHGRQDYGTMDQSESMEHGARSGLRRRTRIDDGGWSGKQRRKAPPAEQRNREIHGLRERDGSGNARMGRGRLTMEA